MLLYMDVWLTEHLDKVLYVVTVYHFQKLLFVCLVC